jgi:hypothetical protein
MSDSARLDWFDWYTTPPPKNTAVLAKWSLDDKWREVETCGRGCCVSDSSGCMILPNFWKYPESQPSTTGEM